MTYYFKAVNEKEIISPWGCEEEREIRYLADAIIQKVVDEGHESVSIYDFSFWFGRSPALIRKVMETELVERGYKFIFEAAPEMCEPEPWETQIADQHIHLYVSIAKSPTREYEV
jgi:hypothetical protein